MKIRIQDNSIRLRLTLREIESFAEQGLIERSMQVVMPDGLGPTFQYRLECDSSLSDSRVRIDERCISVQLCRTDRDALIQPDQEGVYIRREWKSPDGTSHRFMAFVEKDRPGSTCIKKEQWIYDVSRQGEVETRPIPALARR
jgi:hypothetical protein